MSLKILLILTLSAMFLSPVAAPAFDAGEPCPPASSSKTAAKMGQVIGSFEIPGPTSIHDIVKNIIQVLSQIEFTIPDDADETMALRVSDARIGEMLDMILLPAGYTWECSGESILVTRDPVAARRRELMLTLARMDSGETAGQEGLLDQKVEQPFRIGMPVEIDRFLTILSPMTRGRSGGLGYAIHGGHDIEIEIDPQGKTIRGILDEIVSGRHLAWEVWDGRIIITRDFRTRLFPLTPSEYEKVLVTLEGQPPSAPENVKEIHFVVEGSTYTRRDDPAVVRKIVLDVLADTGERE